MSPSLAWSSLSVLLLISCSSGLGSPRVRLNSIRTVILRDSRLLPGNSPLLPGDSPLLPGDSRLLPGDSRLLPGDSRLLPGNSPLLPGNSPLLPGNSPLLPGDRSLWEPGLDFTRYRCMSDLECREGSYCQLSVRGVARCHKCRRRKRRCHRDGTCCPGNHCNDDICVANFFLSQRIPDSGSGVSQGSRKSWRRRGRAEVKGPHGKGQVGDPCSRSADCSQSLCCARHFWTRICKPVLQEAQVCTRHHRKAAPGLELFQRCPCGEGLSCRPIQDREAPPPSTARLLAPPPSSPTRFLAPPPSSTARFLAPPPSSTARLLAPPPSSPTRLLAPPPSSPTRLLAPPPSSPMRFLAPPPSSPTRFLAPPPSSPARFLAPPPSSPARLLAVAETRLHVCQRD